MAASVVFSLPSRFGRFQRALYSTSAASVSSAVVASTSLKSTVSSRQYLAVKSFCAKYESLGQDAKMQALREIGKDSGTENVLRNVLEHKEDGLRFLVDLRRDVNAARGDPDLKGVRQSVTNLLRPMFGRASLDLRRISLESQGALIEKVMEYEQVHPYMGMGDVKRRLGYGYRCFGLFHPKLIGEPLVFVHVALVKSMANSMKYIQEDKTKENEAEAAIFYTISASEHGLASFDLGNQLIKRVAEALTIEFPKIHTFSTLSPVPRFCKWLQNSETAAAISPMDINQVKALLETPQWYKDEQSLSVLEAPLMELCKHYLLHERKKDGKTLLCGVENFHISNGAILARINWKADMTRKGINNSAGIMVNYHYKMEEIQSNMETYASSSSEFQVPNAI